MLARTSQHPVYLVGNIMAGINLTAQRGFWPRFKQRTQHGDAIFRGLTALFALVVAGPFLFVALAVWLGFRARARRLEHRLLDRRQPASAPPQAPSI